MLKSDLVKLALTLSAAAGFSVLFAEAPVLAQSSTTQQQMATEPAPDAGGSCNFFEYHSSWDPVACWHRGGATTTRSSMLGKQALAVPETQTVEPKASGSCNFSEYHSSWDPTVC